MNVFVPLGSDYSDVEDWEESCGLYYSNNMMTSQIRVTKVPYYWPLMEKHRQKRLAIRATASHLKNLNSAHLRACTCFEMEVKAWAEEVFGKDKAKLGTSLVWNSTKRKGDVVVTLGELITTNEDQEQIDIEQIATVGLMFARRKFQLKKEWASLQERRKEMHRELHDFTKLIAGENAHPADEDRISYLVLQDGREDQAVKNRHLKRKYNN